MNKSCLIQLLILSIILNFIACTYNKKAVIVEKRDTLTELEKAIISASESIIAKLPPNSTIALFNNSVEEAELTNHVIEEISSYLTEKSSLKIVERDRFEIIEKEQNWQMETGYISDEEMVSIVKRFGAKYVVSAYISGIAGLQRLRVKMWDELTGQVLVSKAYPTNTLGLQMVENIEQNFNIPSNNSNENRNQDFQTIMENGITIDFQYNDFNLYKVGIFEIYIDGTQFYFNVSASYDYSENRYAITYSYDVDLYSQYIWFFDGDINYNTYESNFESFISSGLSDTNVDRRNINNITRMLIPKATKMIYNY